MPRPVNRSNYASAKALLATHWAVETQPTMELTTATFRGFGADAALARAKALRQAQLEMIASRTMHIRFSGRCMP